MVKEKLISSEDAQRTKRQHRQPCSDCPFRRDALRGWLGDSTPQQFIEFALTETMYDCHTKAGPQCAGMAIFRGNICKRPRHPEVLVLPPDKKTVFATPFEFTQHHTRKSKD